MDLAAYTRLGLAFHPATHKPYVAYYDAGINYEAVVKSWDGSA